jgi:hypothetical protein
MKKPATTEMKPKTSRATAKAISFTGGRFSIARAPPSRKSSSSVIEKAWSTYAIERKKRGTEKWRGVARVCGRKRRKLVNGDIQISERVRKRAGEVFALKE